MYALKSLMNIKMEWEWYVTPGLEGFGRGEREKSENRSELVDLGLWVQCWLG